MLPLSEIVVPEKLPDFTAVDIARAALLGVCYGKNGEFPTIAITPDGNGRYNVQTDVLALLVAHSLGLTKVNVKCRPTSSPT